MQVSLSNTGLLLVSMLVGISSAAPAPPEVTLPSGLPPTCIRFDNGVLQTPSCYTATVTTVPLDCPRIECPTQNIYCPLYIKETTVAVPCSTDCCPTTPTHTVTTKCPGCKTGCVIPTETITVTTGCGKTHPGGWGPPPPTPTATLIDG
ncbi:2a966bb7-59bd-4934-9aa4-07e17b4d67a6 [Thermothielavioides terrestris]|uniref:Uncharacterized protein n=2 Tax=Thermothielavioides terrestris TaxID=2587410 RepID=G2R134_THETT|nr:uncharacterized protein THITE_2088011 [Thermothielavioides terrestris NRRL 8126]AEO66531.1 hypothetical protein THITE_2088011 [Thermothielavioides terrestris NRRL 8126]SPQ20237.1 2a966bb7-59bd-4934-9aa4-07e17b4d67a6 [Thermothielavioides terrestris]